MGQLLQSFKSVISASYSDSTAGDGNRIPLGSRRQSKLQVPRRPDFRHRVL